MRDARTLRVVVAEDSAILRGGLVQLLAMRGHDVVGQASDGAGMLLEVARHEPDAVVADIRMPPTFTDEGIQAALELRARDPRVGILVFSQYIEAQYATRLLAGGAAGIGYLLKDRVADVSEFIDALARVADGGTALDPQIVTAMLGSRRDAGLESLTPREREVLGLMAQGMSNRGIARALTVSDGAVEKHIGNVFAKLGLSAQDRAAVEDRRVVAVLRYLRGQEV
jgi:DNA-binding NarL/FixJ family response regulator